MKKLLIALTFMTAFICSCTKCSTESVTTKIESNDSTLSVENLNKADYDSMYVKYGNYEDFRWYETDILLDEFLDEDCDGSISELVNIFQTTSILDSTSFDTQVYKLQHFAGNSNVYSDSIKGFWIENCPIFPDQIKIPYDSAYNLVMSVNLPKPHSQHVTLRNPLGPLNVNPQWIFGNIRSQIWVDATTGEIRESNPAFPDGKGFKMPLGEWP